MKKLQSSTMTLDKLLDKYILKKKPPLKKKTITKKVGTYSYQISKSGACLYYKNGTKVKKSDVPKSVIVKCENSKAKGKQKVTKRSSVKKTKTKKR